MRLRTIQQHCNDVQYHNNTKDGASMNDRTFILFVKNLIKEYGEHIGNDIFISVDSLPIRMQQEYLKQWLFFEGYIEYYEEIFNHPEKVALAIEQEKEELKYWLNEFVEEIEQEDFFDYLHSNDLTVNHHKDNGESYVARR